MMNREYEDVESRFVKQLQALGWAHIEGDRHNPAITGRVNFDEVIQEGVLRERLRTLNPGPNGQPWLDDARLSEAVSAVTQPGAHGLMEANQRTTDLLIKGVTVEGLPGWIGGRRQTIRYIDWENPGNNHFTVISQYRVNCPNARRGKGYIVPDLVLLVNGLPLVVVECKSPSIPDPLSAAVDQIRRYGNQRKADSEIDDDDEGNAALFVTNQLLVATSFDEARVGCIGADFEHYARWKTVVGPDGTGSEVEVAGKMGKARLSEQERLIAGLLAPAHLLDVMKNFMWFSQADGRTIKSLCRYPQYRAVNLALARLKTGKTRRQHGERDQRGGIIWHTQGSGKSLTMVFLVRKMRTDAATRHFKVIVVTDRKDLQSQLSATATLTGETVEVAKNTHGVKTLVHRKEPGLIFATIQKYRDADPEDDAPSYAARPSEAKTSAVGGGTGQPPADRPEVLNEGDGILVLVDEAHRTQAGDLHANLLAGLPNCARIGFTGTPILMGDKKRTHEIFGPFIDRYMIDEAVADGVTVPVCYEGRAAKGAIKDGPGLDKPFADLFAQRTPEDLEAIKKKYAAEGHILDAPELIADKTRDVMCHYVTYVLPGGHKAQVVANSRRAAILYPEALRVARDELLTAAEGLDPQDKVMDDEALGQRPLQVQTAVRAWRYREILSRLEFAPVISGSNNDDPAWKKWTDDATHDRLIRRFKKPLRHDDPTKADPLAFLVVKSMLLTGFDAPILGAMYLDRPIREAELLQAIARVNRTGYNKTHGIVVDYYGVTQHLKEALAVYAEKDIKGALASLKDEIPVLRDRHARMMDWFRQKGIESLGDAEACIDVLEDEGMRSEFAIKFKAFQVSLDRVLPSQEGLPYTADAKRLGYIAARARNLYRSTPELGKGMGAKVRKLIDDHVRSQGIDLRIPPITLDDPAFAAHIAGTPRPRTKALELKYAIRAYIHQHQDEDPVRYRALSARLDETLKALHERWAALVASLQGLADTLRTAQATPNTDGLPARYMPFLRTLLDGIGAGPTTASSEQSRLKAVAVELVDLITQELQNNRSIWTPNKRANQENLSTLLFGHLMCQSPPLIDDDAKGTKTGVLVDRLMEQAHANHDRLVRAQA